MSFVINDVVISLIDMPGNPNFIAELEQCLPAPTRGEGVLLEVALAKAKSADPDPREVRKSRRVIDEVLAEHMHRG